MRIPDHFAISLLILFFSIPLIGSRTLAPNAPSKTRVPELAAIQLSARNDFINLDLASAEEKLQDGLLKARRLGNRYEQACFLLSLGNCSLSLHRYRKAMEDYLEGGRIALADGFSDLALLFASNRASVYMLLGDHRSAQATLQQVTNLKGAVSQPGFLAQRAKVAGKNGHFEKAIELFHLAAEQAEAKGDPALESTIWNHIGNLYLDRKDLSQAEEYLTKSFRIRRMLAPRELSYSYYSLAVLRNAQKDPNSALHLLNSATALGFSRAQVIPPFLYHERAQAKAALGRTVEALADYELSIDLAKQWRLEVLSADGFRVSAESTLQEIYSGYIETGMRHFERTRSTAIRDRMLEAAEENRAVALREGLQSRQEYPDEYWRLLDRLRAVLTASLDKEGSENNLAALLDARLKVAEFEARLGLRLESGPTVSSRSQPLIDRIRLNLHTKGVFLSFQLGEERSYVWAVSPKGTLAATLEGSRSLLPKIRDFRSALATGDAQLIRSLGSALYRTLFSGVESLVSPMHQWTVSPGSDLWDLPFAALTDGSGKYLMEEHTLRLVPSAALHRSESQSKLSGAFLGVADPLYNAADSRAVKPLKDNSGIQYARLPGSYEEVVEASQSWSGRSPRILLTGINTTRAHLVQALATGPSVVHLATHVVQHPGAKDQVMIALGYGASGEQDFLNPTEVASWRHPVGVVVLSGCGSGGGIALPGAGVLGLTRSWILAGARAVVASYWPIPDEVGPLFEMFYKGLSRKETVDAESSAAALHHAQKAMLAAGGWKSNPYYWSAFFVVAGE